MNVELYIAMTHAALVLSSTGLNTFKSINYFVIKHDETVFRSGSIWFRQLV